MPRNGGRLQLDRTAIGTRLRHDLDKSFAEHVEVAKEFRDVLEGIPSGALADDGAAEVQRIGSLCRVALNRYRRALERYTDFLLKEKIPED